MRRGLFYGWVVVAVTAVVVLAAAFLAAGWIAIIAGFAAPAIRQPGPCDEPAPVAPSASAA